MESLRIGRTRAVVVVLLCTCVIGALVIGAVTIADVSSSEMMSYYSDGQKEQSKVVVLRRAEQECVKSGREKWRRHAVMVAAVEVPWLRPAVVWGETPVWRVSTNRDLPVLNINTPTWSAEYKVVKQDFHESNVVLSIKNTPRYVFTLKKPFGNWWYATDIRDMSRTGAGPGNPKGVKLVELRPAAVKNGLKLVWDPKSKTAEVSGGSTRATMRVGYNRTKINGREFDCSACPIIIKGKLFVGEDVISRIVAERLVKGL